MTVPSQSVETPIEGTICLLRRSPRGCTSRWWLAEPSEAPSVSALPPTLTATNMQGNGSSKSPPRKRARTSPASEGPRSLKKDEEFWYDDGTIILIAGNIEFRVYRGPLAKHSPVFRDMLALPQPPISDSTPSSFEEPVLAPPCPAVHVTDSPTDLRHFLRAFVPGEIPMCV